MRRAFLAAVVVMLPAAFAPGQVVLPPNVGVPGSAETVPSPGYDLALQALAVGDYAAALDVAGNDYQGGVKIGGQRWIDSIASAAILGECLYEAGRLGDAVARYEEAMLVFAAYPDWLLSVQFPPQPLRPLATPRVATWGRSERNATPAAIPMTMALRQRGADAQDVLQRGGVLTAAYDRTIRPGELMRPLVIAIYRHGSLLGELARESPPLEAATKLLIRRPAPPNHWSQSWIDVAIGAAYWAQGKQDLAGPLLSRGLLVGNQFDHPLTAWGLIMLGRIALDADQPQRAAKLFEEATYAAADFADVCYTASAGRVHFAHRLAVLARCIHCRSAPALKCLPSPASTLPTQTRALSSVTDLEINGLTPLITPNAEFFRIDTAFSVPNGPCAWVANVGAMWLADTRTS